MRRKPAPNDRIWDIPPEVLELFLAACFEKRGISLKTFLRRTEREIMRRALALTSGKQKDAAALLGLKYTTFHEGLRRLRIPAGPSARRRK